MTLSSQELGPPANPGRFTGIVRILHPDTPIPPGARRIEARAGRAGLLHHRFGPVADLRRLGLLRAVIAEPGLDGIETRDGAQTVSKSGETLPDLWVLGPATEGSTYYNHGADIVRS